LRGRTKLGMELLTLYGQGVEEKMADSSGKCN
jgi:hypothetical protein